ncbi:MAG: hypothetical protein HYR66_00040 [Sphingobacteriales bacterium]|nr:hypothetical protein [Sphingobacteriales bacterium]MBI3717968.1 hypothetical protein [Sphingobacteriales bacterium]
MKTKVLLLIILIAIVTACNKDKLESIPKLKFKSLNTSTVQVGQNFRAVFEFADKEGDVSDSIFIKEIRLNKNVVATKIDTFAFPMPSFPDKQRGEISLDFTYEQIKSAINPPNIPGTNPPVKEPDTLVLRVTLKDKANHVSTAVSTSQFQVIR